MGTKEVKLTGQYDAKDRLINLEQEMNMCVAIDEAQFATMDKVCNILSIQKKINKALEKKWRKVFLWDILLDMWCLTIQKLMIILIALEIKSKVSWLLRSKNYICEYSLSTVLDELKWELSKWEKWDLNDYLLDKMNKIKDFYKLNESNILNEQDYSFMSEDEINRIFQNFLSKEKKSIFENIQIWDFI